jgi:hypothetical protein
MAEIAVAPPTATKQIAMSDPNIRKKIGGESHCPNGWSQRKPITVSPIAKKTNPKTPPTNRAGRGMGRSGRGSAMFRNLWPYQGGLNYKSA